MLTVCGMRSQDTTDVRPVVLPFWMAKEVALDLSEKERLEEMAEITALQLLKYQLLVKGLEKNNFDFGLQVELLQRKNKLLEKTHNVKNDNIKYRKFILWGIRLLSIFSVAYLFKVM